MEDEFLGLHSDYEEEVDPDEIDGEISEEKEEEKYF